MPHEPMKGFEAISFDIGGTIFVPQHTGFIYELYSKFIHQILPEATFTYNEIKRAVEISNEEARQQFNLNDMHYFFTDEDWRMRSRIMFSTLGITENLDELSVYNS